MWSDSHHRGVIESNEEFDVSVLCIFNVYALSAKLYIEAFD
jgi:hypothetical protein